jgi:hypothetical protein
MVKFSSISQSGECNTPRGFYTQDFFFRTRGGPHKAVWAGAGERTRKITESEQEENTAYTHAFTCSAGTFLRSEM